MVRAITILFVLLTTPFVQASTLGVRVMVKSCSDNSCTLVEGRGTCVFIGTNGSRGVYLTAGHVTKGAHSVSVFFNGTWNRAYVVLGHQKNMEDLAIIETAISPDLPCTYPAEKSPDIGEYAIAMGYPNWSRKTVTRRGRIVEIAGVRRFTATSIVGDSGGPILNKDCQLIGITKGNDLTPGIGKPTVYTNLKVINTCLFRAYGRLPNCYRSPRVTVVPVVPTQPNRPIPAPNNSKQLSALEGEISRLREQLDQLSKTQIPVQIIGANNEVLSEDKYLLGNPIKLRFKAVVKSEAE